MPGVERGPSGWKPDILAVRPHGSLFLSRIELETFCVLDDVITTTPQKLMLRCVSNYILVFKDNFDKQSTSHYVYKLAMIV